VARAAPHRPVSALGPASVLFALVALAACTPDLAEIRPIDQGMRFLHPYMQPQPGRSIQRVSLDGGTTHVSVAPSLFEKSNPFDEPPGSNFIDTVQSNMYDSRGREMPNTLPSSRENPYNLHDGPVAASDLDPRSPTTDLRRILERARAAARDGRIERGLIQEAIDIVEGNPVFPDRAYNGFPVLHYNGPDKIKRVEPIYDEGGTLVGGNVDIHQIWFDSRIESDTAALDVSAVFDVPWTITYTVDILARGADDFAPFVMYVDDPYASRAGTPPRPGIGMDQTFLPMAEGTRNVLRIKMTSGKYFNLTYHWGWRIHPPRIQVAENALKTINGRTIPEWERMVFGDAPTASREAQLAAIAKIGELAPAKRMWTAFRDALDAESPDTALAGLDEAAAAFDDWRERTRLPSGIEPDPEADLTLVYANNTIYGEMRGGGIFRFDQWKTRPQQIVVALINADNYVHGYENADFGGNRGWENQFQSTLTSQGSGAWFTFGRAHWWVNAGGPWGLIDVPPAEGDTPGRHKVVLDLDFEPSRRLRMYQFDPYHHDVAIFSIH
jgi:hypothetical protein